MDQDVDDNPSESVVEMNNSIDHNDVHQLNGDPEPYSSANRMPLRHSLESNITVFENQNNENLERDHELMETQSGPSLMDNSSREAWQGKKALYRLDENSEDITSSEAAAVTDRLDSMVDEFSMSQTTSETNKDSNPNGETLKTSTLGFDDESQYPVIGSSSQQINSMDNICMTSEDKITSNEPGTIDPPQDSSQTPENFSQSDQVVSTLKSKSDSDDLSTTKSAEREENVLSAIENNSVEDEIDQALAGDNLESEAIFSECTSNETRLEQDRKRCSRSTSPVFVSDGPDDLQDYSPNSKKPLPNDRGVSDLQTCIEESSEKASEKCTNSTDSSSDIPTPSDIALDNDQSKLAAEEFEEPKSKSDDTSMEIVEETSTIEKEGSQENYVDFCTTSDVAIDSGQHPEESSTLNAESENAIMKTDFQKDISDPSATDYVLTSTEDENSSESAQEKIDSDTKEVEEEVDHEAASDFEVQTTSVDTVECIETSEKSIEFTPVNLDTLEGDKESEKGSTSGKELDPIASVEGSPTVTDDLDSLDNIEGSEEALTIIPDAQREITDAEKEAASSLPTLKPLSHKSLTSDEVSVVEETAQKEVKVYKYEETTQQECSQCNEIKTVKYYSNAASNIYLCDVECLSAFIAKTGNVKVVSDEPLQSTIRVRKFGEDEQQSTSINEESHFVPTRKCATCKQITNDPEHNLVWEIMDFCDETCLAKFQKNVGSKCVCCSIIVQNVAMGKYCVRFGNDIRQFCSSTCLEDYKKELKVCSYCQQDMSKGPKGFLAAVGEKGQFKDFCSKSCLDKYDIMTNDSPPKVPPGTSCNVCKTQNILIEFEHENTMQYFCGEPCYVAFCYVNQVQSSKCAMCKRFTLDAVLRMNSMYYDNSMFSFCSNSCQNIYIIANRKIVPCNWCKVKKYNFDMIKKYAESGVMNMCSINCLNMLQVSLNAMSGAAYPCNFCQKSCVPVYHIAMSDSSMRNFCTYNCVLNFQSQYNKNMKQDGPDPVPAGNPQKSKRVPVVKQASVEDSNNLTKLPIITNVQSLANTNGPAPRFPGLTPIATTRLTRSKASTVTATPQTVPIQTLQNVQNIELPVQVQQKHYYIVKEKPPVDAKNVMIQCRPRTEIRGTQTTPNTVDVGIQTDNTDELRKILLPVPVPIYVPSPCHMYAAPVPFPVPFPIPIPCPIFIPTTRNSAAGIMKEIKKIQVKIPTDPYEAELLMMAEMVAEQKKEENTDSESDIDDNTADGGGDYSPEPVDSSNTFGDDMLQMALKMATELDEPAVDLEGALTANTITAPQGSNPQETVHPQEENVDDPQPIHPHLMDRSPLRGRKRPMRGGTPRSTPSKRGRRMSHQVEMPSIQPAAPAAPPEPQEKPDANMCLKYTFGVNAWKQWVTTKNAELEKSTRRLKLFKTEILQLTADELNYSLCLFVKEVRKPNGQEYAPDTIYYLCLGIQQYLFENGRIDNIFCDPYYEKFTDCLDEVAKKFSVLYNDSHYIVTRVEEEHLWESKQLGAHSPHVLLSTLMFFNTKHFNLTTVDEHMQLSFSHIMKHWKRNPNQPGASKIPGSRNVLLRFYPPQSALQNNQRKKKVYEQQENEENPLRCPVKLYEFYLSKCPESVKTRNDVFYLQPERSCVPDSPVWYSTMPLAKEALEKMLHRVKMVKEINVALLTS